MPEVKFHDIDEDGDLDIVVTNDFAGVDVLQNNGDWYGRRPMEELLRRSRLYRSFNWYDLDGDGREEIVCTTGSTWVTRRIAEQYIGEDKELNLSPEQLGSLANPGFWFRWDEQQVTPGGELPTFARTGDTLSTRVLDLTGNGQAEVVSVPGGITRSNRRDASAYFWRTLIPKFNQSLTEADKEQLGQRFVDFANRVRSSDSYAPDLRSSLLANVGDRWVNLAGVAGIDQPLDTRSLAYVDWDQDGDWDIVRLNRNAPRLMVLRNNMDVESFVSIRLQGTRCNRDAIGARVELFLANESAPMVRTLDCRSSFLTQSSRRLIFKAPGQMDIAKIVVHWPGGDPEEFSELPADSRHLRIVQGEGKAESLDIPRRVMAVSPFNVEATKIDESTLWPKPLLPRIEYLRADDLWWTLEPDEQRVTLIHLWSENDPELAGEPVQAGRTWRTVSSNRLELRPAFGSGSG